MAESISRADIIREQIRRVRCRDSLHSFALNIDIPTSPHAAMLPDEDLLGPAASLMTLHHAKILQVCENTVKRPFGRALIMAPPGSAKSTYVSVVTPPWAMGRIPGTRIILTSYNSTLAQRQSRRARQIVESQLYRDIWTAPSEIVKDADPEWNVRFLSPEGMRMSELLAAGLTAGITGNRANGAIVDDPVAGREEADSPAMRKKILDAYQDDLLTRMLPGAWLIFIMTRWNEADLAGEILPLNYKGESGMIKCRDGLDWEVLNIPAKAEHVDDPIGRRVGEYLWPEYYPEKHWKMFENGVGPVRQRTWSSLYQQRPSPQGDGNFKREYIKLYDKLPESARTARRVIFGDWAVTEGANDFTEFGVFVLDHEDNLYAVDWWYQQVDTGVGMAKFLELLDRHNITLGFNEGGTIDKAIRPLFVDRVREWNRTSAEKHHGRKIFCDLRTLPSVADKKAKGSAFVGKAAIGQVWFPREAIWTEHVVSQCLAVPAGRHDDAWDVCGLAGRAQDQMSPPKAVRGERKEGLKPFTGAWIEYEEKPHRPLRYR